MLLLCYKTRATPKLEPSDSSNIFNLPIQLHIQLLLQMLIYLFAGKNVHDFELDL